MLDVILALIFWLFSTPWLCLYCSSSGCAPFSVLHYFSLFPSFSLSLFRTHTLPVLTLSSLILPLPPLSLFLSSSRLHPSHCVTPLSLPQVLFPTYLTPLIPRLPFCHCSSLPLLFAFPSLLLFSLIYSLVFLISADHMSLLLPMSL